MEKNKISLRPFQDTDVAMFTSWLHKDYILKWYQDPEDWLTEINGRHDEYAWIHHFIVMDNKISIGFCQYYDCYNAKDLENWYTVNRRGDMCSIDYLIGNEEYLGKGYGKEIVRVLTGHIKDTETTREIVVQPDQENNASKGVLLANGYVFDKQKKYYSKLLKSLSAINPFVIIV
ncbi:MAG: GNAT family N-acetyltransferase [Candidatus Fimivivens sp.]|nr:GNAT family N-acetyltransferase [Candidatus Fimivivens sp.]